MTEHPRISLEQWRCLLAVVDAGGYAQAAAVLHKSQSAVSYGVQKLEALLGVKAFEVVGRKAQLTSSGEVLYRRAKALLEEASALEGAAGNLAAGWESGIAAGGGDHLSDLAAAAVFRPFRRGTAADAYRTVRKRAQRHRRGAVAAYASTWRFAPEYQQGFAGDPLMRLRFVAMAHPHHPLHQLGRELTLQDLRQHRHLIIRDTGSQRRSGSWVGAEQSWTLSQKATSIHAASMGLGFAWFPEDTVRGELERTSSSRCRYAKVASAGVNSIWCLLTAIMQVRAHNASLN